MYTIVVTQPDLAYVVGVVNRYMSSLGWNLCEAIKHIFKYLRGFKDVQLTFG